MEATVLVRQLRWSGHVSRMEENRLPKAVLYSELRQGKRDRSGPRKRFKDQLKYQLTMAGLESKTWESTAADKNAWRSAVNKAAVMLSNTKRTAEMHNWPGERVVHPSRLLPQPQARSTSAPVARKSVGQGLAYSHTNVPASKQSKRN